MKAQNNEILVIKNEEIIIRFISIYEEVELSLSIENKMNDLIDIYCKEKGIKNNNQTIFLYENENISEKNGKIKELIKEGSQGHYLNIWVIEKENVKTNIEYEGATLIEKILPCSTKVIDLNVIVNENIVKRNENKNENKIENIENNFIVDGQYFNSNKDKDRKLEDLMNPKDKNYISLMVLPQNQDKNLDKE